MKRIKSRTVHKDRRAAQLTLSWCWLVQPCNHCTVSLCLHALKIVQFVVYFQVVE